MCCAYIWHYLVCNKACTCSSLSLRCAFAENPLLITLTTPVLSEYNLIHVFYTRGTKIFSASITPSNSRAVDPVSYYSAVNVPLASATCTFSLFSTSSLTRRFFNVWKCAPQACCDASVTSVANKVLVTYGGYQVLPILFAFGFIQNFYSSFILVCDSCTCTLLFQFSFWCKSWYNLVRWYRPYGKARHTLEQ